MRIDYSTICFKFSLFYVSNTMEMFSRWFRVYCIYVAWLWGKSGNMLGFLYYGSVVSSVALTSNSDYLVAGSKDMHVYFFRCNNSYLNYLWRYNVSSFVYSVSISPKGDYVAVGAGSGIFLIDKNGDLLWERKPGNSINSVSISSDERYIAVSAEWDISVQHKGDLLWKDNYPSIWFSCFPKQLHIGGLWKVLYKQDINDDSNGNGESQ